MPPKKSGKDKAKKVDLGPSLEERFAKVKTTFNQNCRAFGIPTTGHVQEQLALCYTEGSAKLVLSEFIDLPLLRSLLEALQIDELITELCFWRTGLGDGGAIFLGGFLQKRCITSLDLLDNGIGPRGAAALSPVIEKGRKLKTLILDHNPITEEGIRMMCGAMRANFDLQSLSLCYCRIGPEGGKVIAQTIIANSRLQELNVKGNQLGGAGILAIAQALRHNKYLDNLVLSDNGLRDTYGNRDNRPKEEPENATLQGEGVGDKSARVSTDDTEESSSPSISMSESRPASSSILSMTGELGEEATKDESPAEEVVKNLITENDTGVLSSVLEVDTVAALAIAVALKYNSNIKRLDLSFNLIGRNSAGVIKDAISVSKQTSKLAEFIVTERLDSKLYQDLVKFEGAKKKGKKGGGKKKKKK